MKSAEIYLFNKYQVIRPDSWWFEPDDLIKDVLETIVNDKKIYKPLI